ncbi:Ubiquitin system component Cue protein [Rutstroemia sp. NJR-2017a BBW]|nr:Ubiquitin system component Cue protein [Rutstroemia sp. NJR-2017a BBW]
MSEQTVNLPQLLIVILVGVFAIRYLFFSGSTTSGSNRNTSANNVRAREGDVEHVSAGVEEEYHVGFAAEWGKCGSYYGEDTEWTGIGEFIRTFRPSYFLPTPPQSFQPPPPAQTPTSSTPTPAAKPAQPDLITRYNLKAKLAAQEAEAQAQAQAAAVESETKPKQGGQSWSANKGERQALLQKRREEMILAARRKMEERVKAEKAMSG